MSLEELQLVFSSHSEAQIRKALRDNNGNLERAAEALLQMESSHQQSISLPKPSPATGWHGMAPRELPFAVKYQQVGVETRFHPQLTPVRANKFHPQLLAECFAMLFAFSDVSKINLWHQAIAQSQEPLDYERIVIDEMARLQLASGSVCSTCGVSFSNQGQYGHEQIYQHHRKQTSRLGKQMHNLSRVVEQATAHRDFGRVHDAKAQLLTKRTNADLAYEEACRGIFRHFNLKYVTDPTRMDVHGLHADEATDLVFERLTILGRFDVPVLTVITGVGNHSLNGRSTLRPTLLRALTQHNFAYIERNVSGQGGQVEIQVKHHG